MIFQHTWQKVVSGEKTQTRQIMKAGDMITHPMSMVVVGKDHGRIIDTLPILPHFAWKNADIYRVVNGKRTVYQVDKTYAVQPARGKPAIARIHITDIRREDVRDISYGDSRAEGFLDRWEFMMTWVRMHDKTIWPVVQDRFDYWNDPAQWHPDFAPFDDVITLPTKDRPAEKYQAWALTFEVSA